MSLPETKEAEFKPADFFTASLQDADPAIYRSIRDELARQQDQIELIASENIVSRAVLEAQGSVLTNKYAEGLPGRRYYGGCENVDIVERLAIERRLVELEVSGMHDDTRRRVDGHRDAVRHAVRHPDELERHIAHRHRVTRLHLA